MNSDKSAVAIFVKTPGYSPIKTRLAKTIGRELAEQFFTLTCKVVTETVIRASNSGVLTGYYAVAEESAASDPAWNSLPTLYQGDGDLGDRLQHIYSTLKKSHESVILIGADSPQLNEDTLISAANFIRSKSDDERGRCVISPTLDGGFYLFGSNSEAGGCFLTGHRYSTEFAFEDLLKSVSLSSIVRVLERSFDVDTADDLKRLVEHFRKSPPKTAAQSALRDFVSEIKC